MSPRGGLQDAGFGGGGAVSGTRVVVPKLAMAGCERLNLNALLLDNFPLQRRFDFSTAGLLGCEFFAGKVLSLDFTAMKLTLHTA